MASPVFHALAGAGLTYVMAGDGRLPLFVFLRKSWGLLAAAALLAGLPDVDYLPGLLRGALNTTHQQATHSLAWALLASVGFWLAGRTGWSAWFGWRAAAFILILIGSHLAVDLVTEDRLAPYGLPLLWPFTNRPFLAPFALLPAWDKTGLADLGSWRNLRALGIETGAGVVFMAGCVGGRKILCKRGRHGVPALPNSHHPA